LELELSSFKSCPNGFGCRKYIFCNCYSGGKDSSVSVEFCFIHALKNAIQQGWVVSTRELLSDRFLRLAIYEFKKVGISGHSPHRSVNVWIARAMQATGFRVSNLTINTFNGWSGRSAEMHRRYREGFGSFSLEDLLPLNSCVEKASRFFHSFYNVSENVANATIYT